MHKTNICFDSKLWNKYFPNIETKIKKILKKSINSERKFLKKTLKLLFY